MVCNEHILFPQWIYFLWNRCLAEYGDQRPITLIDLIPDNVFHDYVRTNTMNRENNLNLNGCRKFMTRIFTVLMADFQRTLPFCDLTQQWNQSSNDPIICADTKSHCLSTRQQCLVQRRSLVNGRPCLAIIASDAPHISSIWDIPST